MTFLEFIEDNDISNIEAFRVFLDNEHNANQDDDIIEESDYLEYLDNFNDSFCGEQSIEDYVNNLVDDMNIGDLERNYVDIDAMVNDIECAGDMWEIDGFLFRAY